MALMSKKANAVDPAHFRPIIVSSLLVRTLHKALAIRLKRKPLDRRQRAFRDTDGCTDKTMLLGMVIKYHWRKFKTMYMAMVDMAKVFDSVSH